MMGAHVILIAGIGNIFLGDDRRPPSYRFGSGSS